MRTLPAFLIMWCLLCPSPALSGAGPDFFPDESMESVEDLAEAVRALGLGDGAFVVGARLTAEQVEQARANQLEDAYPGTIKFSAGEAGVVAAEESHLVLAVYQRREEVGADEVREMVGRLVNRFGEPTTMAHGRLIYWAFGPDGKITESAYREGKDSGRIDILATVKFNSTLDVAPGMDGENTEETGTIYYIITSDRLLNSFIDKP